MFKFGTKILTPDGYKNVETLKKGDKIINKNNEEEIIEDIFNGYDIIYELITINDTFLYLSKNSYILTTMVEETHYMDNIFVKIEDLNYNKYLVKNNKTYEQIKSISKNLKTIETYTFLTKTNTFISNGFILSN